MRFMIMIKADKNTEAGVLPDEKLLTEMGKYNEELVKAGVMIGGEGLQPSMTGARLLQTSDGAKIVDGPFAESKELVGGFWIWECKSVDEAKEWLSRVPNPDGSMGTIELRRIASAEDFGENLTPELREKEEALRAQTPDGEQYRA